MNPPIKMKLKSRGVIPNGGGFFVIDPLTGMRLSATTFDQLMVKARASRLANNEPIGLGFEEEVEGWCCLAHPLDAEVMDERLPKKRNFTLDDIKRGTQVMLAFVATGSPTVSQEEANRRASVCARCPLNIMWIQSCSLCEKLGDLAKGVIGSVRTNHDQQLFSCAVCGCYLKSAVHLPLDLLNKSNTSEMNEAFRVAQSSFGCWHDS